MLCLCLSVFGVCVSVYTGRGRGEGGFYQRGPEEGEVGFGRSREMHRSQSWDDRYVQGAARATLTDGLTDQPADTKLFS